MKAKEFHNCGLELSKLYNELKIFKTLEEDKSVGNIKKFTIDIAQSYQRVLERHENHIQIDIDFKSKTARYHLLSKFVLIKIVYYIQTAFIYHLLILLHPIIIVILFLILNIKSETKL